MGASVSPAERLRRKQQREQDARIAKERAIRRANAVAGDPDPGYYHEFPDLYDADGNRVPTGTARDLLAPWRPSFDDPQTEDGTGTPGTPGNQGGAVPPTQGDPSNDPSNNARDRAIRRANAVAGNPDPDYYHEFPDLYDADGNKVSATGDGVTGDGVTGDGGYESGDVTNLTPAQHLQYLEWMSRNPGDWRRASQALGFDTRQAQAQAPGPNKGAGEMLSKYFIQTQGPWQHGDATQAARDPADLAAALIIDRDRDKWEQDLKAAATAAGSEYDSSDLDGIIRNFSYADNAGKDPQDFIDNAIETYRMRGQSGGDRAAGGYNTLWADEDPSRYSVQPTDDAFGIGGPDPSADHAAELDRLQELQYGLSDEERSTRGPAWTAIQAQIEGMYGGAYDTAQAAKAAAADTSSNVPPPTGPPPTGPPPGATYADTPPAPYSARPTNRTWGGTPWPTAPYGGTMSGILGGGEAAVRASGVTPEGSSASTMGDITGRDRGAQPPPAWGGGYVPPPPGRSRGFVDRQYGEAVDDYMQGPGFSATPWRQPGAESDASGRRGRRWRRREARTTADNRALGTATANDQMTKAERARLAWERWNQPRAQAIDPTWEGGGQ